MPDLTLSERSGNSESVSGKSELKLGAKEYDEELREINEFDESRVELSLSSSAKFSLDERGELIRLGALK